MTDTHDTHTLPKRFKKLVWFKEGDPIPAEAHELLDVVEAARKIQLKRLGPDLYIAGEEELNKALAALDRKLGE